MRATPFSICSGFSTALAVMPGVKYFLATPMPIPWSAMSMLEENFLLPMNTLKLPSSVSATCPMMSFSGSLRLSSVEKDWATAP